MIGACPPAPGLCGINTSATLILPRNRLLHVSPRWRREHPNSAWHDQLGLAAYAGQETMKNNDGKGGLIQLVRNVLVRREFGHRVKSRYQTPIRSAVSSELDVEPHCRAFAVIDCDVDETGHTDNSKPIPCQVLSSQGYGLHGLIDRIGPNGLNLCFIALPD